MKTALFDSESEKESFISTYKDPFNSGNVEKITMRIGAGWFGGDIKYKATIDFKNGDTEGVQRLVAEDFPSLVREVELFIKSLE